MLIRMVIVNMIAIKRWMNRQISYPFSVFVINKVCVGWTKYRIRLFLRIWKLSLSGFALNLKKCRVCRSKQYCTNLNIITSIVIFDSAKIAIEHANEVTLPHDHTYMSFKRHRNNAVHNSELHHSSQKGQNITVVLLGNYFCWHLKKVDQEEKFSGIDLPSLIQSFLIHDGTGKQPIDELWCC